MQCHVRSSLRGSRNPLPDFPPFGPTTNIYFKYDNLSGRRLSLRPEAWITKRSQRWFVRSESEVEQNAVSVERLVHYAKDLEPEVSYEIPENKPALEQPTAGEVEFRGYSARYMPELDLVLKEISMTMKPK
ncbi:hypothetical protein DFH29DRAFT_253860 [Suillus ampliporus]|nr:hypothetical protein DFH29DRAFT_253860 [Suillus ampliporus]